jgi:hypothetical protein
MRTTDPRFGFRLRPLVYARMAMSASGLVTGRYAQISYVTPVCGSRSVACTDGMSMQIGPLDGARIVTPDRADSAQETRDAA